MNRCISFYPCWWFQTWILLSIIKKGSSFLWMNSYFSRWFFNHQPVIEWMPEMPNVYSGSSGPFPVKKRARHQGFSKTQSRLDFGNASGNYSDDHLLVITGYFTGMKNILFAWGDLLVVITGISGHNCKQHNWSIAGWCCTVFLYGWGMNLEMFFLGLVECRKKIIDTHFINEIGRN